VGLVAFLFGVSGRTELPGGVLAEMLGEFGLSPAAVRQLLARMRAHGQLAGRRVGRRTLHRLVGPIAAQVDQVRAPQPAPPSWDGSFHAVLHHVPERHRAFRDRLRRVAGLLGYGALQPGVLIAVADRAADLDAALGEVTAGAESATPPSRRTPRTGVPRRRSPGTCPGSPPICARTSTPGSRRTGVTRLPARECPGP